MKLVIDKEGLITALYDVSLAALGEITDVTRASFIDWASGKNALPRGWYVVKADEDGNCGPLIGHSFEYREDAEAFERKWLEENTLK